MKYNGINHSVSSFSFNCEFQNHGNFWKTWYSENSIALTPTVDHYEQWIYTHDEIFLFCFCFCVFFFVLCYAFNTVFFFKERSKFSLISQFVSRVLILVARELNLNINAGLDCISSWQSDRNIEHKCLHVGVLKWISNPTCLILISKAHKHGLTSSALKSKKKPLRAQSRCQTYEHHL